MNKEIVSYNNNFAILVPIYYDFETKPAWRKVFIGTKTECENIFDTFPNSINATYEENKKNRENALKEYLLFLNLGKKKKAEEIKLQYNL